MEASRDRWPRIARSSMQHMNYIRLFLGDSYSRSSGPAPSCDVFGRASREATASSYVIGIRFHTSKIVKLGIP